LVVYPDSGNIDRATLDPTKCYLQITHLEPWFSPDELRKRKNFFERTTNLSEFVFVTPFTLSGKAHGSLGEQYKRKTILTTAASFPYVLKRIPVVSKREIVCTPIENGIHDLEQRTILMQVELERQPPNPKTLQNVLQGSVRAQVNAGAAEICKIFLGNAEAHTVAWITELKKKLEEFLKASALGIELNGSLIEKQEVMDQREVEFQEEMRNGYEMLRVDINKYLSLGEKISPLPPSTLKSARTPSSPVSSSSSKDHKLQSKKVQETEDTEKP